MHRTLSALYATTLRALTPSFLHHNRQLPKRPTSWLDGCRGWAALAVVLGHFCNSYFSSVVYGYGVQLTEGYDLDVPNVPKGADGTIVTDPAIFDNTHIHQLPILRLFAYGDPMVAVFFVVSGYSLSLKPLRLIRAGTASHQELLQSLASSIIRRPIRLILPCIVTSLLIALAAGTGMFDFVDGQIGTAARDAGVERPFFSHFRGWISEWPPPISPTLSQQLGNWYADLCEQMTFFRGGPEFSDYDGHLWTIPLEYKCSILLFVTLAATAVLPVRRRLCLVMVLVAGALTWGDDWATSCFWGGMLLCELDMIRADRTGTSRLSQLSWAFFATLGLFMMSYPAVCAEITPWSAPLYWATKWLGANQARLLHTTGAVIFTAAVSRLPHLSNFFSNELSRYLGRISFALYLVHGIFWRSMGFYITLRFLKHDGIDTDVQYRLIVAASFTITFPVIIYCADVFCRLVDEPVVRFAKWVETCAIDSDESLDKLRDKAINGLLP